MLMQTGLIERLANLNYSIAIISPDKNDENLKDLAVHENVQLIQWESKATIWDDDYLHKRMYFLEDIRSNTALLEKFHNGLFYSKSKHPWKRIRPLYYYLIYRLIPYFPSIRRRFIGNEQKHLKSIEADKIINDLNPRLVISTYPVSIIEAKILHAAKKKNVHTLLHLLSWDNISCKGKFPVLGDSFIAWGDIMKEELQETYQIPTDKISICGVPHFDQHIQVRGKELYKGLLTELNLNSEKPYLFFAMSSPRFAPKEIDIVTWLAEQVETNEFGSEIQLIIRPHPQNVTTFMAKESWLDRLEDLKSSRVAIDYPKLSESKIRWSMKKDDMKNLSILISGCSVCFNSGSTVSIDALMHDKPVLITAFDGKASLPYWNSARRLIDYAHLKKYISEGGAKTASSFDELTKSTKKYLISPQHNLEDRRAALYRECYLDDGESTQRVVNAIKKLVTSLG